ncbi:hypothetical protein AVEN_77867-1 [Araneus ventricosus]|uniref:Uncharacterized protein n=1 Tax=Araneus ventricosus TaxID=182803 RepID=A0A4Y2PHT2_ARAVE|nr:hypothetical protein AVEN_77867-1 [Araneus ventricosus]
MCTTHAIKEREKVTMLHGGAAKPTWLSIFIISQGITGNGQAPTCLSPAEMPLTITPTVMKDSLRRPASFFLIITVRSTEPTTFFCFFLFVFLSHPMP